MSRPFRIDPTTLLAELRADLIKHGVLAFSPGETAKRLGMTPAAIQARLGKRDEVLARVWIDARRTYVAAVTPALEDKGFPESIDRVIGALGTLERSVALVALGFDERSMFGQGREGPLRADRRRLEAELDAAVRSWAKRHLGSTSQGDLEDARFALLDAPAIEAADALWSGGSGAFDLEAGHPIFTRAFNLRERD